MTALDLTAPLTNRGPRLSDLAFERLADAIVDGVLAPGELLRDHVLAEQLGVSRMPIREALQRLERAGLVETAASRYTRVTEFSPERIAAGIEYAGYLHGAAVRMATIRMTADQHARAVALLDELVAADGVEKSLEVGAAFFGLARSCSGNDVFERGSDLSYFVARITRGMPEDELMRRIACQRERLRDAVASRDADAAELAVRRMHGIA
ncbi:GntR family transcriptional regulator [Microbacterium sp. NPDC096154]|uniref:GntR family transcriptional regulator n=1 Tax=Microbacterium sp. NPDC096154 TaxID=3155549 RepID=UPI003327CA26